MKPDYIKMLGLEKAAKKCRDRASYDEACKKLLPGMDHFGLSQQDFDTYREAAWRYYHEKITPDPFG